MWELFILAVALSMDAFAVANCKGLSTERITLSRALLVGAYFGGFQALMPTIGFFLAFGFRSYIESFDHWIAFALLVLIGFSMIRESLEKSEKMNDSFGVRAMLPLAVSTSIDAMAAGVELAVDGKNIWLSAAVIGVTTFILSAIGLKIGNLFGAKYKSKAELCGGIVLVLMGVHTLLEHLGVL